MIDKLKQIKWKQGKFIFPLFLYPMFIMLAYLVFHFFNIEKADIRPSELEKMEELNASLPDASLKDESIPDKYSAVKAEFGSISDLTAIDNIDRTNGAQLEEYTSKYTDEEALALLERSDSVSSEDQDETVRLLQESIRQMGSEVSAGSTVSEEEIQEPAPETAASAVPRRKTLDERKAEAQAQLSAARQAKMPANGERIVANENAVTELNDQSYLEEVAKVQPAISDYFNTIGGESSGNNLVQAIVDEEVKAIEGSRVRLKLLSDIEISGRVIRKGQYLYMTMSGFSQQRVKGTIKSVLVGDELVKVNLSVYDVDGLEGLYVPKSQFREAAQQIGSSAFNNNINMANGGYSNSVASWGIQSLQQVTTKTMNAISKAIRKNKTKIKYGTTVFLINSREQKKASGQNNVTD